MTVRDSRLAFISIGCAVVALVMAFATRSAWALDACQDFDPQCMRNGVCQADGTCAGDAINEGQPCNTGDPCALTPQSAQCQSGHCVTTTNKPEGTACTFPGAGLCIKNTTCQSLFGFGPFCMTQNENDIVDCDALGQKCMACDPNTGQCTIPMVPGPCETGECNPATGLFQDAPNGTACDDFNVCTADEQCQGGVCRSGTAPTPTPTVPIGPATCTGDCNNLHVVTVDNLLTMIDIGLGKTSIDACMLGDKNQDFKITVDEILGGVGNALNGCPALPTPTPTPTGQPQAATPTPTATTGGQPTAGPGSAVSGQTSVAIGAVSVIGDVVAAIASGFQLGTPPSALTSTSSLTTAADPGLGQAAAACPGGTGTVTKTGELIFGMTITFSNDCTLPTFDGTVAFNGTALVGLVPGINVNVTADYRNTPGTLLEHVVANVHGPIQDYTPVLPGGQCFLTGINLMLTGTLSTTATPPSGPTATVTFTDTMLDVRNIAFNLACVPTTFDLILNGEGGLLATGGSPVDVYFNDLALNINGSGNPTTMTVNGEMSSPCFGGAGATTLTTSTTLTIPSHQNCPTAGVITSTLGSATITFGAGGSVHIQSSTENLTAPNCYDPRLLACVA